METNDKEIREAANQWVFDKNSSKWSNNDNTAGDNFNSFVKGAEWFRSNQSTVIQNLEAEKAELLEALEIFVKENTPILTSHAYEFPEHMMKAKSLIQKHKK